jgi:hypothetical protein
MQNHGLLESFQGSLNASRYQPKLDYGTDQPPFDARDRGVSPARASVVLKRPRMAVQHKARELGKPFVDSRQVQAMRLARETQARQAILATNRPCQTLD